MTEITLTDSQRQAQPLLEQFGIIVATTEVNEDFYKEMSWALYLGRKLHPDKPLELRCHGDGGYTRTAFAIVDLIQLDGNIDGVLIGNSCSSHSFIWAACARRYVTPFAIMSVHGVSFGNWNARLDQDTLVRQGQNFELTNTIIANIYAQASSKSAEWWMEKLRVNGATLYDFNADALINDLQMANPIKDRES